MTRKGLKWLIASGIIVISLWACSEKAPVQESTPVAEPVTETLPETGSTANETETLPAIWQHLFFYANDGGTEGRWILGNEYELHLEKAPYELFIYSQSMGTPHAKFVIEAIGTAEKVEISYLEYIEGNGWEGFQPGDLLLSLHQTEAGLETHWETLKPIYGEPPTEAFQKK